MQDWEENRKRGKKQNERKQVNMEEKPEERKKDEREQGSVE